MKFKIAVGKNRYDKNCINTEFEWVDFLNRIARPMKTAETYAQYMAMDKGKQGKIKDVGGFIAGETKDGKRQVTSMINRCMITLDADTIAPNETQKIINLVDGLCCTYAIYSTRKHSSSTPRLRIVIPTSRLMTPDEYEPAARMIAKPFLDILDKSTFDINRIMYWPSCSTDSEFIFTYNQTERGLVNVDYYLNKYKNWRDANEWPRLPNENEIVIRDTQGRKLINPCDKKGIIGAFNTVYDIHSAIAQFLPDVYEPRKCRGQVYTYWKLDFKWGSSVYRPRARRTALIQLPRHRPRLQKAVRCF